MGRCFISLIVLLLLSGLPATAQFYYYNNNYYDRNWLFEFGATTGLMNCITDLGGKSKAHTFSDISFKHANISAGLYFSATCQDKISLRLQWINGETGAADSVLKPVKSLVHGRYERNLSFKTRINEIQLAVEVFPVSLIDKESSLLIDPYLVIGAGLFNFDPKAELAGQWYSLQPLRTEGQGFSIYKDKKPYSLTQLNFSLGAGLKYDISPLVIFRIEFNYRFLHTDYLDDVSTVYINPDLFTSYLPVNLANLARQLYDRRAQIVSDLPSDGAQRGNPEHNDAYFSLLLKTGIVIGRRKR